MKRTRLHSCALSRTVLCPFAISRSLSCAVVLSRVHFLPLARAHACLRVCSLSCSLCCVRVLPPALFLSYSLAPILTRSLRRVLTIFRLHSLAMGWLRLVGSIILQVSFAEYSLCYWSLLRKRPIILSMLLTVPTPYLFLNLSRIFLLARSLSRVRARTLSLLFVCSLVAVFCSVLQCIAVCCSVLRRVAVCCSVLQCTCSFALS